MAKHPKTENERNPLRQLRECLSKEGRKFPITQGQLSDIIGVSTSYIRLIEADQRPLTAAVLSKVLETTGAEWDNKKQCWVPIPNLTQERLFNFAVYTEVKRAMIQRPSDNAEQAETLWSKICWLFTLVPDSRWWDLYFRLVQFLEDCRKDFRATQLEGIYQSVSASISANLNNEDRSQAIDEFKREYQEQLRKRGYQKKGWLITRDREIKSPAKQPPL